MEIEASADQTQQQEQQVIQEQDSVAVEATVEAASMKNEAEEAVEIEATSSEAKKQESALPTIPKKKKIVKKAKKAVVGEKSDYQVKLRVCKFLQFHPASIECMSYSGAESNYVAVGRSDSSVEIWRANNWSQLLRFQASASEKPVHVQFVSIADGISDNSTPTLVLLVFCVNGLIKLYDLKSHTAVHEYNNTGGYIWGVSLNERTGEILTACEDGFIRIIRVDDEYGLKIRFVSSARTFDERAISVCWDNENVDDFYGSYDSGLIRRFNKSKQVIATMDVKENAQKTVGWKICSLRENTLAVGCSDGQIRIFETRFGTVTRSFRKHEADVTTIVYNATLDCFYASGADSKIVAWKRVRGEWILFSEDRGQSHDIKQLLLIGGSEQSTTLISGGLTTDICAYNLLEDGRFTERASMSNGVFGGARQPGEKKRMRHILGFDQNMESRIESAQNNLVLLRRAFSIELWEYDIDNLNYQFLIELNVKSFVQTAAISSSGGYLAYSTEQETCVFKLNKGKSSVTLSKLTSLAPSLLVKFSDSQVISGSSNKLEFLVLVGYDRSVSQMRMSEFSALVLDSLCKLDSDFATASHIVMGPKNKSVFVGAKMTNLISEISLSSKNAGSILFEVPALCDSHHFNHLKVLASTKQLVVSYENRKFAIFDLITKQPSKWTKDNFDKLPQSYLNRNNHIMGILKHPKVQRRLVLYTTDSFIVVDLSTRAPRCSVFQRPNADDNQEISVSFTIKEFAKPIIFALENHSIPTMFPSNEQPNSLTLFQIDFQEMLQKLPGAIMAKKFGK